MHRRRPRSRCRIARAALLVAAVLAAVGVAVPSGTIGASGGAPTPGTDAQVLAAVRTASRISALPLASFPSLGAEPSDSASRAFPATSHGCLSVHECVFGDLQARRTIVLYGDSHAQMWLSAVVPAAEVLHYRVVLLFLGGCPFADVTVWNPAPLPPFPAGYYTACDAFRREAIRAIVALRPRLVLLSNRTSMVESGPDRFFTRAQWLRGDRATLGALRRHVRHVAVIGDIVYMDSDVPECLAANPTSVQRCATPSPNPAAHSHEGAERAAAWSTGARFIDTLPWVCSAWCSPVVGPFLVYLNDAHLDATYVTYLSGVMLSSLRWVLGVPVARPRQVHRR